jgi:hypothetical protein
VSLGSGFPGDFLATQIARRLRPGVVIKLYRKMDDGRLHEKRFVVLLVDTHTITCVINSEIGPFIRVRPEMLRSQVQMPSAHHGFMDHDSHVDCSRTRAFLTDEVVADLKARPEWILGDASDKCCADIVAALKASPTISVADVQAISNSMATRQVETT